MRLTIIFTIFRKDLRDAIRDSRILVALLVPLGIGLAYFVIFPDSVARPSATIAYSAPSDTSLPTALRSIVGHTMDLTLIHVASQAEVQQRVQNNQADLGLAVPSGFDKAIEQGKAPVLIVVQPESPSTSASYVLGALDPALRQMAGQHTVAAIQIATVNTPQTGAGAIFFTIGLRRYFVLTSLVMLIGMITMLAVPTVLAEERDKKTLEALMLVASYPEVIVAKALLGIAYLGSAVLVLLALTRVGPTHLLPFIGGIGLLSVAMIGYGLLLGSFLSANQLNTWGSLFLIPVIIPGFFMAAPLPTALEPILLVLPSTHAMRLLLNGMSTTPLYGNMWVSALVIILWGAVGFALVAWRLKRQET